MRSFLGLCIYYRRFVPSFASLADPLHKLTKKGNSFKWTEDCQRSFDSLRNALTSPPILANPDFSKPFILDCDASDQSIGAVLSQKVDGIERVCAYASRTLSKSERKYCVTRKELLAVVHFVKHFRHYLYGRQFLVRTYHSSLLWLMQFKNPQNQLARWLEILSEFDFQIQHRPGRQHSNADALGSGDRFLVHTGSVHGGFAVLLRTSCYEFVIMIPYCINMLDMHVVEWICAV